MERRRRIEIPEAMIQHIQSFLSEREAARTTILSKSWYTAWLTRPNLDLSELYFLGSGICTSESEFVKFANKSMQRYEELKRKIRSLRLRMYGKAPYKICLANEMIGRAMKLGATDLHLEIAVVLPYDLLQSQTLTRLSLIGGAIDLQDQKVTCSRLKSLHLSKVRIHGSNNLWDSILICPSIEKLILSKCQDNNNNSRNRMLVLKPGLGLGLCVYESHKMGVLSLEKVEIGDWFFRHISRFTCLKELTIEDCHGYQEIQICSNSLECISFNTYSRKVMRLKFDVPRISKFKFSGYIVPSLSLKTTSIEWESDILIRATITPPRDTISFHVLITSWFHELRDFLWELSPSKISLSLQINIFQCSTSICLNNRCGDIIIRPKVEKLTLLIKAPSSLHSTVLEDLFRTCRPDFITLYWLPSSPYLDREFNNGFTRLLYNTLSDYENQNMSALFLHGLKKVYVQFFEDGQRCPLSWMAFLEAANSGMIKMEVCLQLEWG